MWLTTARGPGPNRLASERRRAGRMPRLCDDENGSRRLLPWRVETSGDEFDALSGQPPRWGVRERALGAESQDDGRQSLIQDPRPFDRLRSMGLDVECASRRLAGRQTGCGLMSAFAASGPGLQPRH